MYFQKNNFCHKILNMKHVKIKTFIIYVILYISYILLYIFIYIILYDKACLKKIKVAK